MTDSDQHAIDTEAMLEDLKALVEIESPSRDLKALADSAAALSELLVMHLGGSCQLIETSAGPHVLWSGGGEPKVLLLGHHDTVFPLGTLGRRPFRVEDGRATGPGVFDMLGGIVQAVHGLKSLPDRSGVQFLITADEEVGSPESRGLIEAHARACGNVLVLEGAGEGGALKTARKGCGTFKITILGRAAHAGLEPERGINALVEAAHQIQAISRIQRPEGGTTVTPTMATAGTADNVVPAEATIWVDVRVESMAEKHRVEQELRDLSAVHADVSISIDGAVSRPPMPESTSKDLFALAEAALPGVGRCSVGGGSDGNFTAAIGVPTLDGLGAVGGGAHADHEYLIVDRMAERADLVAGLVKRLQSAAR